MVIWKKIFNKKSHPKGQMECLNCIMKEMSEFTRWLRPMNFRHTDKHAQSLKRMKPSPIWGDV